ncbi:hypothetical protein AAOE16_00420 [Ekhidna sp. MALMAid0563]|uniref:hypothetical protein n=1 Tax=Ekhidna sp. MALMAid0563 TaxID=3143937 RepID=UPI0032DE6C58
MRRETRWVTILLSSTHYKRALADITLSGFEILTGFNKEAFLYKRAIAEKEI